MEIARKVASGRMGDYEPENLNILRAMGFVLLICYRDGYLDIRYKPVPDPTLTITPFCGAWHASATDHITDDSCMRRYPVHVSFPIFVPLLHLSRGPVMQTLDASSVVLKSSISNQDGLALASQLDQDFCTSHRRSTDRYRTSLIQSYLYNSYYSAKVRFLDLPGSRSRFLPRRPPPATS